MTQRFNRLAAALGSLALLLSITACTSTTENKPTHKKATSICLIKSEKNVAGSPTRELAANLVEAQVVFGVRAKVIEIRAVESVPNRLLQALQAGCVLMASAETAYLQDLVSFAKGHSKMMVFFVGGQLAEIDQPANLRWFKDDLTLAARLAGFYAAETAQNISLLMQSGYQNSSSLAAAIAEGVREYELVSGEDRTLITKRFKNRAGLEANLQVQPQPELVVLLAGPAIWNVAADYPAFKFIGADLQFGQTTKATAENVIGSIERGTGIHLLRTVSALLNRDFANNPPTRSERSLTDGLAQLRNLTEPSDIYSNYFLKLEGQQ